MILGTKIFLTLTGLTYIALSIWCTVAPATTSRKVGFDLIGGSGSSEFLVIYGGLEMAMGIIFLAPWIRSEWTYPALWACVVIHACLAIYRTIGFIQFEKIESLTYRLAIGEWLIFLVSLALLLGGRGVDK